MDISYRLWTNCNHNIFYGYKTFFTNIKKTINGQFDKYPTTNDELCY